MIPSGVSRIMIAAPPKGKIPITGPHGGTMSRDFYFYVWPDGHYGGCHDASTFHSKIDRLKSHKEYVRTKGSYVNDTPRYCIVVHLQSYPEKVY